ncbi:E3 ubiquitin/ISG15 ligase TRIM25-like [Denticeps clupeoides]|uniref:E3 ubiquitin/ISG15 ligase TRIM25-like n=1 Tax=Denticeps clupeoides TaxID=299321 RepID=UPI0010A47EED|nr:E3 ubiquitin/ISG15 ligase TRIM25-like [Denticeps clupeoides]
MAEDWDLFMCSVCLGVLEDPVALSCGHNYCMMCIKGCCDEEDQVGIYSCPQCGETFTSKPVVKKNNIIAELVENLQKTSLQADPPALCYAGPGDVECDICTGRKVKAVKSCLVCLVSYCETHFKLHNEVNPGGKHMVMDATGHLEEKICSQHHKLLEVFCLVCLWAEHKNHDIISAGEMAEKQRTAAQHNRRHPVRPQFRVGDHIWLSTQDLWPCTESHTLTPSGPYRILNPIGKPGRYKLSPHFTVTQ